MKNKNFSIFFICKKQKISLSKVLKERIYIKIVPIKVNKINSQKKIYKQKNL